MNSRENLLSLYRRTGYEFVPVQLHACPIVQQKIRDAIGKNTTIGQFYNYERGFATAGCPWPKQIEYEKEPDWRAFFTDSLNETTVFTHYGVAQESGYEGAAHMHRMYHPMATFDSVEQMQAYPWPQWDYENISHMEKAVSAIHSKGQAVLAGMECTIWENSWYLRDMTMLMMDMTMNDEKATYIFDKITSDSSRLAAAFARAGVDIICMGDDIGMQDSIMMSVEMYREWLKPRLTEVVAAAKAENPDVLVQYHSCGYITPYIPDLIDAGVDILNPVQPECMDFAEIYAEFGDKLSFNGTIGTQTTMPFAAPEEVRKITLRNLEIAGSKGGLLACPTHVLEPEVPWENIDAYIKACIEFGSNNN